MLRISQRCEYAVGALLELVERPGPRPITIDVLARARGLPRKFLGVILAHLKQVGLVESERGARGGYRLARPPQQITIGQIVRLVDGPVDAGIGGRADGSASVPHDESVLGEIRRQISTAVERVLERTSLADLVESETRRRAALATNYVI